MTRLTRRGALAAGAAVAVGVPATARAARAGGDLPLIKAALRIEQAAAFAYDDVVHAGELRPPLDDLARRLEEHARAHARALSTAAEALGGAASPAPRSAAEVEGVLPGFAAARGENALLRWFLSLETAAVAAYHDAHRRLEEPALLPTVASIMAVDGQHLVVLREALQREPVPDAFEVGRG